MRSHLNAKSPKKVDRTSQNLAYQIALTVSLKNNFAAGKFEDPPGPPPTMVSFQNIK